MFYVLEIVSWVENSLKLSTKMSNRSSKLNQFVSLLCLKKLITTLNNNYFKKLQNQILTQVLSEQIVGLEVRKNQLSADVIKLIFGLKGKSKNRPFSLRRHPRCSRCPIRWGWTSWSWWESWSGWSWSRDSGKASSRWRRGTCWCSDEPGCNPAGPCWPWRRKNQIQSDWLCKS